MIATFVVASVVGMSIPVHALHAGFFSVFSQAKAEQQQNKNDIPYTHTGPSVQNMGLLSAAASPNAAAGRGGGDILIEGSALRSNGSLGIDQEEVQSEEGRIRYYVVSEGDTLSHIADMFDISINTIRWSNDIARHDTINPGDKLVILPITGVRHTVEEGDTISDIAEEYGGKEQEIREYNNITREDSLAVGDKVIVPSGEISREEPQDGGNPAEEGAAPAPTSEPSGTESVESGYYATPARGAIVTQLLHGYNAVDFAADHGSAITAAAPGEVIVSKSGWNGGYGNYVVIKHPNGTETLYSHNARNIVGVGEQVERGQVIGYMGSTGRSTGTHVHFEVRGTSNPFSGCGLRTRCR